MPTQIPADSSDATTYQSLTPEFILTAIDSIGLVTDARIFTLNSYENRVYQVGIEGQLPVIAKFYRPDRWTIAQIREEHAFTAELLEAEIDVVAPTAVDGETLLSYKGFPFALFPQRGGQAPDLENADTLKMLGRLLGRMHAIGRSSRFEHRPEVSLQSYGIDSFELLYDGWMSEELKPAYKSLCDNIFEQAQTIIEQVGAINAIRCHADFHIGNMLNRDGQLFVVDFDDSRCAPAIQDIWMLLAGEPEQYARQLDMILEAYSSFCDFNWAEIRLIELFRTLRLMHYSAWLARRWEDPAFPRNFPWFNSQRYWSDHILDLRQQLGLMQQAPMEWH